MRFSDHIQPGGFLHMLVFEVHRYGVKNLSDDLMMKELKANNAQWV